MSVSLAEELLKLDECKIIFISYIRSPYSIKYDTPCRQYFLPDASDGSVNNYNELCRILKEEDINVLINQCSFSLEFHDICHRAAEVTSCKHIACLHFNTDLWEWLYADPIDFKFNTLKENAIRFIKNLGYNKIFRFFSYKRQRLLYQTLVKDCDKVVLLSSNFYKSYKRIGKIDSCNKLAAIPNMISFPYVDKEYDKEKRILFCARMGEQKRPERVLYLWAKIFQKYPEWHLDMVGDGPLLQRLQDLAAELNTKNVVFYKFRDPIPFYQRSPIFIMTSNYEGWALTLLEAMQYKCVPIAFESYASITDIIDDGENGFLIKPFDVNTMADKVEYLMRNPKDVVVMGRNAFQKVSNFRPSVVMKLWINLFEDLLY